MALQFKAYQRTAANLEDQGTVIDNIGKKGSLKFVPGTIDRYKSKITKAMAVILFDGTVDKKTGEPNSLSVPLSKRVSATILNALEDGKTKMECLSAIAGLSILENEEGQLTVSPSRGVGGEEETFTVGSVKDSVSYEELVW